MTDLNQDPFQNPCQDPFQNEQTEPCDEDPEYTFRVENIRKIFRILKDCQNSGVQTRRDLIHTNYYFHEFGEDCKLLNQVGWISIDPGYGGHRIDIDDGTFFAHPEYYQDDEGQKTWEWLNQPMDFSDDAIQKALKDFLIPNNERWAEALVQKKP